MEIVIIVAVIPIYVYLAYRVYKELQENKRLLEEQKRKSEMRAKHLREKFGYRSDSRY